MPLEFFSSLLNYCLNTSIVFQAQQFVKVDKTWLDYINHLLNGLKYPTHFNLKPSFKCIRCMWAHLITLSLLKSPTSVIFNRFRDNRAVIVYFKSNESKKRW